MISFRHLTLRRGPRVLLEEVNWTVFQGQHVGLTGANGSGKSSLFSLLLNELHADSGELALPPKLEMAHVAQEMPVTSQTALDFVIDGDQALRTLQRTLDQAVADDDGMAIAQAHDGLHALDAWTAPARAARLLEGLGFKPGETGQAVSHFSGGWQMRLLLAQALMCRSDLLLLDEPTNHLDLDAVMWLTQWLKKYPGTLLVISHDRDFLDETVQHIAHIENKTLEMCTGNYSDFEKLRAEKRQQQDAAFRNQQQHIVKLQSFINRFRAKASKARQAQSRLKALDRLEIIAAAQADNPFDFQFRTPDACPNPLLQLDQATLAYGDHVVLGDVYFSASPGDRIALIGPNGAGKSTLIRALAGELLPVTGERNTGRGLKVGYFAQHHVDHLQADASPLEQLTRIAPTLSERELRGWLGSFGFRGDRVHEPVRIFSGGEKSRLALALIVWQKPNLLLLDEPTNHLDMGMRDALSLALQAFSGAVVLVSHDRFMIRSTMDQLVLVAGGQAAPFSGDLETYEKWLTDFRNTQSGGTSKKSKRNQSASHLTRLEQEVTQCQRELEAHEKKLLDPELHVFEAREKLAEVTVACERLRRALRAAEEAWLKAAE